MAITLEEMTVAIISWIKLVFPTYCIIRKFEGFKPSEITYPCISVEVLDTKDSNSHMSGANELGEVILSGNSESLIQIEAKVKSESPVTILDTLVKSLLLKGTQLFLRQRDISIIVDSSITDLSKIEDRMIEKRAIVDILVNWSYEIVDNSAGVIERIEVESTIEHIEIAGELDSKTIDIVI